MQNINITKLLDIDAFKIHSKMCDGLAKPKHIKKFILRTASGVSSHIPGSLDSPLIIFTGSKFFKMKMRGKYHLKYLKISNSLTKWRKKESCKHVMFI